MVELGLRGRGMTAGSKSDKRSPVEVTDRLSRSKRALVEEDGEADTASSV
jgi:hypothetical protein